MPDDSSDLLADLVKTIGLSASRVGIIRIAYRDGQVTADQLMDQLGIARSTLTFHIKPLVDAGILIPEMDPTRAGKASGFNRLIWWVDRDAVDQRLHCITALITGN
ncbi:winged helix-turn-helix transcriptional regulator [Microbacterium rhizomatis]|nr:helix-turn-helix domain-containing protein [Microbacterium rhizomatis]